MAALPKLTTDGRPAGSKNRRALVIAGDDAGANTLISNNGARLPPLVARITATALAASTLPAPSVAAAGARRVACLAEAHLPHFA